MIKKLCSIIDRFEKIANFPDVPTVSRIIANTVNELKSNPILAGVKSVAEQANVSTNIDNNAAVYFQLIVDPKVYQDALARKSEIDNFLKPIVTQNLAAMFRQYKFNVTIGIVPVM